MLTSPFDLFGPEDLLSPETQERLARKSRQFGWFVIDRKLFDDLEAAAEAVGQELPTPAFDSVEDVHVLINKYLYIARQYRRDDGRRETFFSWAMAIEKAAIYEFLKNRDVDYPKVADSPDVLREKALLIREQARNEASDYVVRQLLLAIATKAERRALGIDQGDIKAANLKSSDYEKQHFEFFSTSPIDLTGCLPFRSKANSASTAPQTSNSAGVPNKTLREEPVELFVDVVKQQATLQTPKGEEQFDLPSEGVARWLKVLADRPDQWIRPDDYKQHGGGELDGVKPSDKLRALKKTKKNSSRLATLIEPSKHGGMRFVPSRAR